MEKAVLKEVVRGKGEPNRNGIRQMVPVATLWATCVGGVILVGWSKRHAGLDHQCARTGEYIAEGRAYTLHSRLGNYSLRLDDKGFTFVDVSEPFLVKERTFPYIIQKALPAFLVRCEKYFQQGRLTHWAALVRQATVV